MGGRKGPVRGLAPRAAAPMPSESSGLSPVLLVPDPVRATPSSFRLFATGSALLRFASGLNGFRSIWPERLDEEHADRISAFFGVLRDWIAAPSDRSSIKAEPDLSRALDERIKELAMAGFVVSARERFLLLTGGRDAKPEPWRIVDIKVQPAIQVRIADPPPELSNLAVSALGDNPRWTEAFPSLVRTGGTLEPDLLVRRVSLTPAWRPRSSP